jgi:hypothetical protein
MSALRYLIPIILLGLVIVLVNYYTKPSFTMTSTINPTDPTSSTPAQYGSPFSIVVGEAKQFPDFSLKFIRHESVSMGVIAGVERMRENYVFEVNAGGKQQQVIWGFGYPGGLGGAVFSIGRRHNFIIDGGSDLQQLGQKWVVTIAGNGAEYEQPVTFSKGKVLEYPDFDLSLVSIASKKHLYTDVQRDAYIQSLRQSLFAGRENDFTPEMEKYYRENYISWNEVALTFEVREGPKVQQVQYQVPGLNGQRFSGGQFTVGGQPYIISITNMLTGASGEIEAATGTVYRFIVK